MHISRSTIEELLVRVEQSFILYQVGVVFVIKHVRRRRIQGREVVVAAGGRTGILKVYSKIGINVGFVEDPVAEEKAACLADGVCAGKCDQVLLVETLCLEGGDEA